MDPGPAGESLRVVDNPDLRRYEIREGEDVLGVSVYDLDGSTITFRHTEVDPTRKGLGLGSRLAAGALDDVRARGLRVVATCPFISAWIRRHRAEYGDLLAG